MIPPSSFQVAEILNCNNLNILPNPKLKTFVGLTPKYFFVPICNFQSNAFYALDMRIMMT